jgi:CheY-like chemotaxis protein
MVRKKAVLVVEDDRDIREVLCELLEMEGYIVHTAVNGRDGLDRVAQIHDLDLVIVDYRMPYMDGYEFRLAQLQDARLAHIPTILMSADSYFAPKITKSFTAFLAKPLCMDDVLEVVARYTAEMQTA